MDSGRCRRCGRPYTVGEIAGVGILRTRPAHRGGPVVELPCPGCKSIISLIPYGHGRYAQPGEPPPPPPADHERTVPWRRTDGPTELPAHAATGTDDASRTGVPPPIPTTTGAPPAPPPPPRHAPPPPRRGARGPRPSGPSTIPPRSEPPPPSRTATPAPLSVLDACEILGVTPTASTSDVERAYRERALLCHPDKVSHLDPDFVALAETKFRRLQAARDLFVEMLARPAERSGGRSRG